MCAQCARDESDNDVKEFIKATEIVIGGKSTTTLIILRDAFVCKLMFMLPLLFRTRRSILLRSSFPFFQLTDQNIGISIHLFICALSFMPI